MNWQTPPPGFRTVIFGLTQPAENVHRYYYITWQTDLFGERTVVRSLKAGSYAGIISYSERAHTHE